MIAVHIVSHIFMLYNTNDSYIECGGEVKGEGHTLRGHLQLL